MGRILKTLDSAIEVYREATGTAPRALPAYTLNGRATIAELPNGETCGAGCGLLGANGIELMSSYFMKLYTGVRDRGEYNQVLFYELGRNFWFYGDQLAKAGPFASGFAIANRFISMDRSRVKGAGFEPWSYTEFRDSIVTGLLDIYLKDPHFDWRNTLLADCAPASPHNWSAADLAGAMIYRIYRDGGFDAYKRLWRAVAAQPIAFSPEDAMGNFLRAAKAATDRDYEFLFTKTSPRPTAR